MPRLELRFLGGPRLTLDDRPVKLDRRKAEALLTYLVVEGNGRRRSELALLLWPEQPPARARAALRRTLRTLTAALGKSWFDVDRNMVGLAPDRSIAVDVTSFDAKLARAFAHPHGPRRACDGCARDLAKAVSLHRGDFLAGLTLKDARAFDEWQFLQAERLRDSLAAALEGLVRFHVERGRHGEAMAFARRWVLHDPLDETSHETLMTVFLDAGKRGAALRLYDDYARRLRTELWIDPPRTMTELRHRVRMEPVVPPGGIDRRTEAFRSACERRRGDEIERALDPLCREMDRRGLYRSAIELLDLALAAMAEGSLSGKILARQGALLSCVGQLAKARALLEAGLRSARETEDALEIGYCENRLGAVAFAQGDYRRARRLLRSSVDRYREAASTAGLPWALNVWGHLAIGTREARSILTESLERGRRAGDEGRIASALNSLGKERIFRRDYEAARENLEQSLVRRREQGHRIGIADSLNNLGRTWLGLSDFRASRRVLEEACDLSRAIDARPLLAEVLLSMAAVQRAAGETERSARSAASALRVPGAWRDARDGAKGLLEELSLELPRAVMRKAIEGGS